MSMAWIFPFPERASISGDVQWQPRRGGGWNHRDERGAMPTAVERGWKRSGVK